MLPPTQAPGVAEDPALGPRVPRLLLQHLGDTGDLRARTAWLLLGAAMAVAAAVILWLGRGATFTADELQWFMNSPGLGADGALRPHGGHLILTTRVAYAALLDVVGPSYIAFRLLGLAAVLLTVGLFYAYASRRIGRLAALAPCLVLLVYGSDPVHVLSGNAFTVLLAVSCGIGAFLALDRHDRVGNVVACILLCLGVLTYGVALAFTLGAAVSVLTSSDRRRRVWIVAVPVVMYGAWWLWARGSAGDERHTDLASILLIPAWGFTALGAVLKALTGLGYRFPQTPGTTAGDAGPALALAVLAVLGWRLRRRPMPPGFWPALAVAIGLWTSQALGSTNYLSTPTSVRYLLPGSIIVLMAAVAAAGRPRWSRNGLLALWAVAAIGVATNLTLLRDSGRERRDLLTVQDRAMLAGLEIAGPATVTGFRFDGLAGSSDVAFAFVSYIPIHGGGAAERYFRAADRYGDVGYSVPSLRRQAEPVRALADKALVAALGLKLALGSRSTPRGACRPVAAQGATTTFALPTGAGVLLEGATGPVQVRRFASASAVAIGAPQPGQPAVLRLPRDRAPAVPWTVTVPGTAVRVCAVG